MGRALLQLLPRQSMVQADLRPGQLVAKALGPHLGCNADELDEDQPGAIRRELTHPTHGDDRSLIQAAVREDAEDLRLELLGSF